MRTNHVLFCSMVLLGLVAMGCSPVATPPSFSNTDSHIAKSIALNEAAQAELKGGQKK